MNIKFPCKNCPDRHRACWDACEKYKECVEKRQKEKEAKYKIAAANDNLGFRVKQMRTKRKSNGMKLH